MNAKAISILIGAIGVGAIAPASAADVYVNGTMSTTLTLQSFELSGGAVTVRLLDSGGGGTPTDPTPTDPTPTDPTPTDPTPSACGALPSNVVVVDAGVLGGTYKQALISPASKDSIVAFKITVPATGAYSSDFRATKTTSANLTKLLSVSSCPGQFTSPVNNNIAGCVKFSTESSRVYLTSDQSASARAWCVLQPGQTYYVNAVSKEWLTSTGYTCTSGANCTFLAAGSKQ